MREDFHKVIVEKARWGSWMRGHRTRWSVSSYDPECEYALPGRESSSWNWYVGRKDFSDRLGPLERYLGKQVGRPWSKIEGEFRKALDMGTVIGRHLWDHARHMVDLECRLTPDGRVVHRTGYPVRSLYVHPRTGLLLRPKIRPIDEARARRKRIAEATKVVLDSITRAEKEGDLWYLFIDTGRKEEVVDVRTERTGKKIVVRYMRPVIRKKQANTEEIRLIHSALERTLA